MVLEIILAGIESTMELLCRCKGSLNEGAGNEAQLRVTDPT
jgi:hypothetical protein